MKLLTDDAIQEQVNVAQGNDGRWTPADNLGDIRCDEDYEAFYRAQLQAGKRLPPPLDSSTVYQKLPAHLQQGILHHQRMMAARSPAPNGESQRVPGFCCMWCSSHHLQRGKQGYTCRHLLMLQV